MRQTCGWGWSVSFGAGMSRRWTLFGLPGRTATAFIADSPDHGDAVSIARTPARGCRRPSILSGGTPSFHGSARGRRSRGRELVYRRLGIRRSRSEDDRREAGLVQRVGIVLRLQAEGPVLRVGDAPLALE